MKMQRSAGILLPISSLPSPYGIGCFSQEAYDFVDWLKEAGQTYWQILPLGVTSYGDSPYQSFSAFAGNPYFISLDALVEEGVLTAAECKKANFGRKADNINYSRLYTERGRLLRLAYSRSDIGHNEAFAAFCEKNKWWLDDFALFMAVKDRFEGKPWIEWAEDIRLRWQPAMDYYRRELYFEVEYHKYLQFKFDEQWRRLKAYANSKGIRIIGDIPIYVALDSADAWANPGLFQLDTDDVLGDLADLILVSGLDERDEIAHLLRVDLLALGREREQRLDGAGRIVDLLHIALDLQLGIAVCDLNAELRLNLLDVRIERAEHIDELFDPFCIDDPFCH